MVGADVVAAALAGAGVWTGDPRFFGLAAVVMVLTLLVWASAVTAGKDERGGP